MVNTVTTNGDTKAQLFLGVKAVYSSFKISLSYVNINRHGWLLKHEGARDADSARSKINYSVTSKGSNDLKALLSWIAFLTSIL